MHEDGARLADARLIAVRRPLHDGVRRLDLAIMDATAAGVAAFAPRATRRAARRARSDRAVQRDAMDEVLAPHALGIGRIEILPRAPHRLRGALSIHDGDEAELCREVVRAADPWSLPVVIVDGFGGDGDGAEDLIGWAPVSGVLRVPDSPAGCVFVGSHRDLQDGAERNAAFAMTLLHEAGHFMGLEHVSEADNLMFWSGVPEFAPFVLSDQQADVLRAHPLFHPARSVR